MPHFPDTIRQFGRILIRTDDSLKLAEGNFCRYELSKVQYPFAYKAELRAYDLQRF